MVDRTTLVETVRRHAAAVVLSVLVIAGIMVAVGLSRDVTHTAEADLIIGNIDPRIGGVSEFLTTTQGLAKGYTRVLDSDRVMRSVARATGLTQDRIRSSISAQFDEKRPILRLTAKAGSAHTAILLASSEGDAVTAEINRINSPFPSAKDALARYRSASKEAQLGIAQARQLQAQLNLQAVPSKALQNRLDVVRAGAAAAQLRQIPLRDAYQAARANVAHNLVRVLTRPSEATSDRARMLEFLAYVGVVAGLAVGLGIATYRSRREFAHAARLPMGRPA